jgi:hypothetical protein
MLMPRLIGDSTPDKHRDRNDTIERDAFWAEIPRRFTSLGMTLWNRLRLSFLIPPPILPVSFRRPQEEKSQLILVPCFSRDPFKPTNTPMNQCWERPVPACP